MASREDVINAIKDLDHIDIQQLQHDIDFGDQGMDSLDIIQTLFEIQDRFDIEISETAIENKEWSSIDKIVTELTKLNK
jgi:acyl carrier protein